MLSILALLYFTFIARASLVHELTSGDFEPFLMEHELSAVECESPRNI